MERRTADAGAWVGDCGKRGAEFASGEGVKRAQAGGELEAGEAAFAAEATEKIGGGLIAFLRIAFETAGNEVAIGIAAEIGLRHNVVEAPDSSSETTQAIETKAALARVNGEAELFGLEKIEIFETGVGRQAEGAYAGNGARGGSGDFVGEPDLNDMTGFGALDETQNALGNKAAKGLAGGLVGEACATGEPGNREVHTRATFEATVANEVRVHGTVDDRETMGGNENVFKLLPEKCGVEFFVVHG